MEIRIQTHFAAENFLSFNVGQWDVIYICNSDKLVYPSIRENSRSLLELVFDDIDFPMGLYVMPAKIDVEKAISFSVGKRKLLVTCYGGLTRSAAIAYVCKCKECNNPAEAIHILTPLRHYPNKRVISYAAELLDNQNIYKVYDNWMKKPVFNNVQNS